MLPTGQCNGRQMNQTTSWEKHFEHKIGTYQPEMFTPILANNYIIFPTNNTFSNDDYASFMYFLNMEGKEIKKIPFLSGTTTQKFVYVENGVIYNQDNRIISW
jgi:hypothetical protein